MPGQDQYVAMPDGSYIHIPGDATPEQLSQLHDRLSAQADPLRTGAGMIRNAQDQNTAAAKNSPAVQPVNRWQGIAAGKGFVPPQGSRTVDMPSASASGGWAPGLAPGEIRPTETMEEAGANARDAAITAGTAMIPWERAAVPVARFAAENVLPVANKIPYVGAALKYAEEAPSLVKAMTRGATGGATVGGVEQGLRTRSLTGAAKGALYGGAVGAGAGALGYGINKLAAPPTELPTVNPEPYVAQGPPEPYPPQGPQMPYVPQGPPNPMDVQGPPTPLPTVRRVPGDIAPERVSSGAEPRMPTVSGPGNQVLAGGGGQIVRPQMALPPAPAPEAVSAEMPKVSSMRKLQDLIQTEGAGAAPPLKKNVPLGDQLFTPPKAPPTEMPSVGQKVSDVVNTNTEQEAVRPLSAGPQKSTPLRQIAAEGPPAEPVTHRATVTHEGKTFGMEAANGRKMYEATAHSPELARDVHLLYTNDATKGPTVRNAFMNLGGDVNEVGQEGQRFKAAVKGPTERVQMFDWLLDHGHTPEEIIAAAKKTPGAQ